MQGCRSGVAPHRLTSMNHSSTTHRFYSTTRTHLFSVRPWCSFSRLNSPSGTRMKKKSMIRKAQAVPVIRFRGKMMSSGKQLNSNSSTFLMSLMGRGSSSATTGAFLAISSKLRVLSSPFFLASSPSLPSLQASPSSPCGSISFLMSLRMTMMRKKRTVRKHRKTTPRWQFWPCELAIIQIQFIMTQSKSKAGLEFPQTYQKQERNLKRCRRFQRELTAQLEIDKEEIFGLPLTAFSISTNNYLRSIPIRIC